MSPGEQRQPIHRPVYGLVVEGHLWTGAAVTSLALFVTLSLDLDVSAVVLGLVFTATILIYTIDGVFDRLDPRNRAPHPSVSLRTALLRAAAALFGLLGLLSIAPARVAILVGLGAAVCSIYGVPLVPSRPPWSARSGRPRNNASTRHRLKDLPGFKGWLVGLAVSSATVSIPMVYAGRFDPRALPLFVLISAATLVNAHIFDIRDRIYDLHRGLRTLPVSIGVRATRQLLTWLTVICCASAHLLSLSLGPPRLSTTLAVAAALLACIWSFDERSPRRAFALFVDGVLLLPLAATLAMNLWSA